jgi:phage pi2 protein 07
LAGFTAFYDMDELSKTFVAVSESLRKRGLKVHPEGVPMLSIENHPYAYAPDGKGSWHHIHQDKNTWTRLITHDDPEAIAEAIHAHFCATKKSGDQEK